MKTFIRIIAFTDTGAGQWRVIALTNNYSRVPSTLTDPNARIPEQYKGFTLEEEMKLLGWDEGAVPTSLRAMFDDFVDSSEVGMRYVLRPPKLQMRIGSDDDVQEARAGILFTCL